MRQEDMCSISTTAEEHNGESKDENGNSRRREKLSLSLTLPLSVPFYRSEPAYKYKFYIKRVVCILEIVPLRRFFCCVGVKMCVNMLDGALENAKCLGVYTVGL